MRFVYVIYSETTNSYYIGETNDVEKRIEDHNLGIFNKAYKKKLKIGVCFST